jgi:hypothetical protein
VPFSGLDVGLSRADELVSHHQAVEMGIALAAFLSVFVVGWYFWGQD